MVANFGNVPILFSSSKLLKLKYIHHYFFLKCLTKKLWCILWSKKYGMLYVDKVEELLSAVDAHIQ